MRRGRRVVDRPAYSQVMAPRRRSVRTRVLRAARHSPHLTAVQIAAVVGCHRSTVRKHLHRAPAAALAFTSAAQRRVLAAEGSAASLSLGQGSDSGVRGAVARRLDCPPWLLHRLANDPDFVVRRWVAGNENCPQGLLARLGGGDDVWVRHNVAGNENCPRRLLTRLAGDDDRDVRMEVAVNENCPPETLNKTRRRFRRLGAWLYR